MWERLRRARIATGLSIEQLSAKTKIRVALLELLERGEIAPRLGDFYTRAALRAIACELDLDPEEIVREYAAEYAPQPTPPPEVRRDPLVPRPPLVHPLWRLVFVATAAVVLVSFLTTRSTPSVGRAEPRAVGTTGIVVGPAEAAAAEAPAPAKQELSFELRTKSEVWVSATADGESVLYGLLQPSGRHILQARQELMIVIGDAAAVEYSINGQPGRVLGGSAEVRKILLTPNNYAQFVQPRTF